jgi:hypothetical protein
MATIEAMIAKVSVTPTNADPTSKIASRTITVISVTATTAILVITATITIAITTIAITATTIRISTVTTRLTCNRITLDPTMRLRNIVLVTISTMIQNITGTLRTVGRSLSIAIILHLRVTILRATITKGPFCWVASF